MPGHSNGLFYSRHSLRRRLGILSLGYIRSSIYRNHRNSNLDLYSLHEIVRIPTFAGDNRVHWTCRCHSHCSRKYYHHLYRGHRFLLVRNLGYNISDRLRNLMPSTVRMRRLEATALYGERPYCTRSRCKGGTTRLWGVMEGNYGSKGISNP